MGKIAVVLGSNIHWSPFYMKYERLLKEYGAEFDLIFWNREGLEENIDVNTMPFNCKDETNNNDPLKLLKFMKFASFVRKTIKQNRYEKIIFLGGAGCAAVLNTFYLRRKYKGKYWVDVRDYQYEWFKPFTWLEKKVFESSFATAISSKGYEQFLPKHDYLYVHNLDADIEELRNKFQHSSNDGVVRISFIGNVRYFEINRKLVDAFANDPRFCLQYFGSGSDRLKEYCLQNQIENVRFVGRFAPKETMSLYEQTDIVNNIYGNDGLALTTALSNKLYYSIAFNLPILVCENTYMEEVANQFGFGITYSDEAGFPDQVYSWYTAFRQRKDNECFEKAWNSVMAENQEFEDNFRRFIYGAD